MSGHDAVAFALLRKSPGGAALAEVYLGTGLEAGDGQLLGVLRYAEAEREGGGGCERMDAAWRSIIIAQRRDGLVRGQMEANRRCRWRGIESGGQRLPALQYQLRTAAIVGVDPHSGVVLQGADPGIVGGQPPQLAGGRENRMGQGTDGSPVCHQNWLVGVDSGRDTGVYATVYDNGYCAGQEHAE